MQKSLRQVEGVSTVRDKDETPEVVTSVEGESTVKDKYETPEVVTSVEGVSTVRDKKETPEVVTSVEGVSTVRDRHETPEVVTSVEGESTVKDTDQTAEVVSSIEGVTTDELTFIDKTVTMEYLTDQTFRTEYILPEVSTSPQDHTTVKDADVTEVEGETTVTDEGSNSKTSFFCGRSDNC